MRKYNKRKNLSWQFTEEQTDALRVLNDAKEKYAREISKIIKNMPEKHHNIAFLDACDVGYEVSFELTKWDYE